MNTLRPNRDPVSAAESRVRLVVSVHDVSPATADQTARWCADLDALGIPTSLLVIPGPWRGAQLADHPDYARVLAARVTGGDEIVLHGWTHRAGPEGRRWRRGVGYLIARGAAEFDALEAAEAGRRLALGRATLAAAGLTADGFTPPGWLASAGTVQALARLGFGYLTTHRGVRVFHNGRTWSGFALSHRPGGVGEGLGARVMTVSARRTATRGGIVRIALHPDDLLHPRLRDTSLRTIERVLATGARAVTYGQLAAAAEPR